MMIRRGKLFLRNVVLLLSLCLTLVGCQTNMGSPQQEVPKQSQGTVKPKLTDPQTAEKETPTRPSASGGTLSQIAENGSYSKPEDVAEYLHTYRKLPPNFITKKQAADLGWVSEKGNLWEVTDKKSIGGDRFGNLEGKLPKATGRQWYECDVNYNGGFRGSERIVYSNDGMIFYTKDHYQTFKQLY